MLMHRCLAVLIAYLAGASPLAAKTKQNTEFSAWTEKALRLQAHMDLDAPLAEVAFPHTHNSYNSKAYAKGFRYIDPNHDESIYAQLALGIRSIELDVHYAPSLAGPPKQWGKKLLLCHGTNKHAGCYPTDRKLEEALHEISTFLNQAENSHEVLVVYIEDHMDGQQKKAAELFQSILGEKIYRPKSAGCQGIPMELTKRQILAEGRNILLMGGSDVCRSDGSWQSLAFAGVGDYVEGSYPTASLEDFAQGTCDKVYSRSFYANHWLRVQEDRTNASRLFGHPGPPLTPPDVEMLLRCRVNLVGLDKLKVGDERLAAFVWSWEKGHPKDQPGRSCAAHLPSGRIVDRDCRELKAFACKSAEGEWYLTSQTADWSMGADLCEEETQGSYSFSLPVNSYDNENLKKAKNDKGDVWINYLRQDGESSWHTPDASSEKVLRDSL